jgi:hypothetical protein
MNTNVFATPPVFAYEGNILHLGSDEITAFISEIEEDLFENFNSTYFNVGKAKKKGIGKAKKKGKYDGTSVPDADIKLLLGTALLFLVLLGRRRIKV